MVLQPVSMAPYRRFIANVNDQLAMASNVHATGEFQLKATTSISTQYPISVIMEADKEPDKSYCLSMESGFKNSPMAKLLREYGSQDLKPLGLSTENKVQSIIGVEELGPEMITDRGSERAPRLPCYHLNSEDWDRVQSAVTELQIFLQQAASLIEKCQNHFLVDPGDMLLPILAGMSSLGQMNIAWKAIQLQVELGMKALRKYVAEYQLQVGATPLTLLSTLCC